MRRERSPVRIPAFVTLLCAVLPLAGCRQPAEEPAAEAPSEIAARLEPGAPLERELASGEVLRLSVELEADRFLELVFDSERLDVRLDLLDPGGRALATAESRASRWGEELLPTVTGPAGGHRLEVRPLGSATGSGRVRLRIADLRGARAGDTDRAAAGAAFNEALRLYESDSQEDKLAAASTFRARLEDDDADAEPRRLARAGYFLGITLIDLDRLDEALPVLEEALERWRELDDDGWRAESLYRIGNCHALAGRMRQALASWELALPVWRRLDAAHRLGLTLNNQGFVHRRQGSYQLALDQYRQALAVFRGLGIDEEIALGLLNVGTAYRSLGEPQRALQRWREALPIWRRLGYRRDEAITLSNIGWGHAALGEQRQALEWYRQALAIAEESGDTRRQGFVLGNIGQAHLDLDEPRPALAACQRGHELSRVAGDTRGQAKKLTCMGQATLALGDVQQAERHLAESVRLGREIGDRATLAAGLAATARLRRAQGRLEEARERITEAQGIVEAVRADVDIQSMRAAYLSYHRDYYELEVELLMEEARRGGGTAYRALALQASERARARSLLELLGEAEAGLRAAVDPELIERERELRREMDRLARPGGNGSAAPEREMDRLVESLEELERRIRKSNPRYAELAYPQPLDLEAIRRSVLADETLLLEYGLGEERSYLWLVDRQRLEVFELPPRREIEAHARRVHELLSDAAGWRGQGWREHQRSFRQAAAELGRVVLGPVGRLPEGRTLLIVADGALHYVPFAALPAPETGGPLVTSHQVVNVPSVSVLAAIGGGSRRPADRTLLVAADPVFTRNDARLAAAGSGGGDPQPASGGAGAAGPSAATGSANAMREGGWGELQRLAHTRQEALAIAELVPAAERSLLLGFDAAKERVTGAGAGGHRILHFATHGVLDSRRPRLSGLVLSLVDERGEPRDGVLRLHDIYDLELDAELVVLSACQTGLGRQIRGEGLVGLTRGFLHAGAKSVVASLWSVDDRATADLMRRFYRGMLEERRSPAAALRAAQLAMLADAGERTHRLEYYWAPFVLYGEWRPDALAP